MYQLSLLVILVDETPEDAGRRARYIGSRPGCGGTGQTVVLRENSHGGGQTSPFTQH